MSRRVAVVDGYSSGSHLVQELLQREVDVIHVRSQETFVPYLARTFRPQDYLLDLGYEPDPPTVAKRLVELGVERVVAGTEPGIPLADQLAELTGMPGNATALTAARRSKYLMSRQLAAAGLDCARGTQVGSPAEAVSWYTASGLPEVVVKPVDSAGSDHVRFCRDAADVARACTEVLSVPNIFGSPNRQAIVQEALTGTEYYTNTVSVDGTHVVVETWRYTKTRSAVNSPVFDFEEPVAPTEPVAAAVHDYARRALTALGVREGAAHSEIVLTPRGPVLVDPAARLGGGVLPWVTAKFLGHSHAGVLAESLIHPGRVARLADTLPLRWPRPVRYVSLINPRPGRARGTYWRDRIAALPTAVAVAVGVEPGARLPATHDLTTSPGFVYLAGGTQEEVEADYRTIRTWESEGLYVVTAGSAA